MSNLYRFEKVRQDHDRSQVNMETLNVSGDANVAGSLNATGVKRVAGYAPTEFATTVAGVLTLNNAPGLAEDTAAAVADAASTTLLIPAGSVVTKVYISNNGTAVVGGTDFNIGNSTDATASALYFTAVPQASVNTGAFVHNIDALSAFATVGIAGLAADNFVTVQVTGTNTAGDLKIVIEYM